jgi:hypothetical protein
MAFGNGGLSKGCWGIRRASCWKLNIFFLFFLLKECGVVENKHFDYI